MSKLILLFYMLLSLTGCEQGRTIVTHTTVNGEDVIYSKILVLGEFATFRCLRSQSGQCYYSVLSKACATRQGTCASPVSTFSMREGDTLMLTALPADFASCASPTAEARDACVKQLGHAGHTAS